MDNAPLAARLRNEIARLGTRGLETAALQRELIGTLRRVLPIDAYWFATADPTTLLFTSSVGEAIPIPATKLFVANEFGHDDVNKWVALARSPTGVAGLYAATENVPSASARYRDILAPLGFGDELRAVLRVGGECWGFLCLHQDGHAARFTNRQAHLLATLASQLAITLRTTLVAQRASANPLAEGPGVVVVSDDLRVVSITAAGRYWLAHLADNATRDELPPVIVGAVVQLAVSERDPRAPVPPSPAARVRTPSGRWLAVYASRMHDGAELRTAIVLEPAPAASVVPLLLSAYGLTPRENAVTLLVLRGRTTAEIAQALSIAGLTVQQHLKAIFAKTGVGSRRELVATIVTTDRVPQVSLGAGDAGPPLR